MSTVSGRRAPVGRHLASLERCHYCGCDVQPGSRTVYQRVVGWQRIAGRRLSGSHGGSDISARAVLPEFACASCVDRVKSGVSVKQGSLL